MIKILNFTILLFLICCKRTNSDNNAYSLIVGDWKEINDNNCKSAKDYEMNDGGYTFFADRKVDMKKTFNGHKVWEREVWERYKWLAHSEMYRGMYSKYEIIHDTLKIQNPIDLTWYNRIIIRISNDSMLLANNGCVEKFVRVNYRIDTLPSFDKIIVSTSYAPLPGMPVYNIIISSNGEVSYFGEEYTGKDGFYTAQITAAEYQTLRDNFRKVDMTPIKEVEGIPLIADVQYVYTTLVKGNKIYRTDEGYYPKERKWAITSLKHLYKTKSLQNLSEKDSVFYFSKAYFEFKVGNKYMNLEKSESFLLWDYLRKGKWTTKTFNKRFELDFEGYYNCKSDKKSFKKYKVQKIETDGQFYKLYMVGKAPITIDIGHNFFDNNFNETSFR